MHCIRSIPLSLRRLPVPLVRLGIVVAGLTAASLALAMPDNPRSMREPATAPASVFGLAWQSWLLIALGFAAVAAGGAMLLREARAARQREHRLARDRAALTEAVAHAEAKSAQLQATLAGMSDGVMMLDADLRLVEWNDHFPEFTGLSREMLRVGLPMEDMIRAQALAGEFGAVDVEAEVQRRMQLIRSYRRPAPYERIRPNGQVLELRRSVLPGGGFVTVYSDVTARKAAEAAQREARRAAEAAIEQRAQFLAMVSHEIRGLLNAVTSSFTLLNQSGLNEHQRALSITGRQAGTELLELIGDVLDLARIDAGSPALRRTDFAVAELLEGVREMFSATAASRGISLGVSVAPEVPARLLADPQRLRQIMINFTSNACKYTRPGPVTLRAELLDPGGPPMLRLSVRDPGPGIPEHEAELLFVPFARLHNARESGVPGTGLGLAICERLTRLMSGQIGLKPLDVGNEFWVAIPVEGQDGRTPPAEEPHTGRRPARRTNVLLVEDVPSNRMLTAALLRRAGHRVDVAESGTEALRLVESRPYDIVFMDLVMPGMGGQEAARRIRTLPGPAARVPIIALTASSAQNEPLTVPDTGMDGLLTKPLLASELEDALEAVLWNGPRARKSAGAKPHGSPIDTGRLADLHRGITPAAFASLVEQCLADIHARLALLRDALANTNAGEVMRAAHALSGVAAGYGLVAVEQRMRAVMQAAGAGDLATVAAELADIDTELERSTTLVRNLLHEQAA